MKFTQWLREQVLRHRRRASRLDRRAFADRFAATLVVKPLESRLVLNAAQLSLSAGNLVIADLDAHPDTLTIQADSTNGEFVVSDPNSVLTAVGIANSRRSADLHTVFVPFASVTGSAITVNTLAGNDSLTIDLSLGNFSKNITFNGGLPTTGTGDSLTLIGGAKVYTSITHTATNASDGTVSIVDDAVVNGLITYTGLEPVTDNLSAVNRVMTFSGSAETISLTAATAGKMTVDSTLSESITFKNPTGSLTLNGGSGNDVFNIAGFDAAFSGNVTINGDAGTDSVNFPTNATDLGAGTLTVNAENFTANRAITAGSLAVTANTVAVNAKLTANGGILLQPTADGSAISLGTGAATFNLDETELKNLASSGTVTIGRGGSGVTGAITVATDVDLSGLVAPDAYHLTLQGGALNFTGGLTLADQRTLTLNVKGITSPNGGTDVTIGGASGTLNVTSAGTIATAAAPLTMSVANFSGNTSSGNFNQFLSFGTTTLAAAGLNAGTATVQLNAGTLNLGGNDQIADTTKITISGGTLAIGSNNDTIGLLTLASGGVTGTTGVLTAATTYQVQSGTISAMLGGTTAAVGLNKTTTGVVTLSGAAQYGGDTTLAANGGTLQLGASNVIPDGAGKGNVALGTNTTLDLNGNSETINGVSGGGAIDNVAAGGTASIHIGGNGVSSTYSGVIKNTTGVVSFEKIGAGVLTLSGVSTYAGDTAISGGTVKLGVANALPGGVGKGNVSIANGATLDLVTFALTVNGLSGGGTIDANTASAGTVTLTLRNDAPSIFNGRIKESLTRKIAVVKQGAATLTLTGANTYTGNTTISAGEVRLDQGSLGATAVVVGNSAVLSGTGSVNGNVSVGAGAALSPGVTIGSLSTKNLNLTGGGTLRMQINGDAAPGTDYDQIQTTGTVNVTGGILDTTGSTITAPTNAIITLIQNDGIADAVVGTLSTYVNNVLTALPENSILFVNGEKFRLSYIGGDGNDITISADTTVDVAASGGDLVITDIAGVTNDRLLITWDNNLQEFIISDADRVLTTNTGTVDGDGKVHVSYAAFNGAIVVNTAGGNDSVTLDFTAGRLPRAFIFNGDVATPGETNELVLTGQTFQSIRYDATAASSGVITIQDPAGNSQITFNDASQVTDLLQAAQRMFYFNGGTITLQDAPGADLNSVQSTTGYFAVFRNVAASANVPIPELTVHAGPGDAPVYVNTLDPLLDSFANVTIEGDEGAKTLQITTTDANTLNPVFAFAGFTFDQTATPNQAAAVAPGTMPGGHGLVVTASPDNPTGAVAFPLASTTGFADGLTIGRELNPSLTSGARAINLPAGNVGTVVRSAIELGWQNPGDQLLNAPGADFVVYESSSNPNGPDGFLVQVHIVGAADVPGVIDSGWTQWRYEAADSRGFYVGSSVAGAFATAFDLSDFGLSETQSIDGIRLAGMTAADRVAGPGTETTVGSGVYRGQGFIIPDDGGATSDTFPDPGPLASFTFFGNSTFDPDPLYIGALHPLAAASSTRSDTILVAGNQVAITVEGVARPTISFNTFHELTVNSLGGTDDITVELAPVGLPAVVNINGGDPAVDDTLTVRGIAGAADDIHLENSRIRVAGVDAKTINISAIENVVIDTADDVADTITIERSFTLAGVDPHIDIHGDTTGDQLIVNVEAPPILPTISEPYTSATYTFDQAATPDQYTNLSLGAIADGRGVRVTSTNFTTNSISGFPDNVANFDASLSLGRLAETGSNIRRLNIPSGGTRNAFELTWSNSRTLANYAGDDLVIYEQGSGPTNGGGPEPVMLQVHNPDTGAWSDWVYQIATQSTGVATDTKYATTFDLSDFGIPDDGRIDAIRVANLLPGDRVVNDSGEGVVLPAETNPVGGYAPKPGPLASYATFTAGVVGPELDYLGVLHPLVAPQTQGVGDTVSIDPNSVDVVGFIPITYLNLDRVTINTAGGADRITARPGQVTAYTLNAGEPANAGDPPLSVVPGDRLELNLTDELGAPLSAAELLIAEPGSGVLSVAGLRSVTITDVDSFGIPPTTATPARFDVRINSDSGLGMNSAGPDTFNVDREQGLTEVTLNGTFVFRGDTVGLNRLLIDGSFEADTLNVDFQRGDPIPLGGLEFRGEAGLDQLTLRNGTADTVTNTFTTAEDGTIDIDRYRADSVGATTLVRSTIKYFGLNLPTRDELLAQYRVFNFRDADDDLALQDVGGLTDDFSQVINDSGATFVDVQFRNPTASLTLNGAVGNDVFKLHAVDQKLRSALTLNGGAGNDRFQIDDHGSVKFVVFPVTINGGGAPFDDVLIVNDSADNVGSAFSITETTIGGQTPIAGSAVNGEFAGAGTPVIDGVAQPGEWDHVPVAFDSGARPGQTAQTVLHWTNVDGTGRQVIDDSAFNNNGTLFAPAGPTFDPGQGQFDGALKFDGVDDYAWFQDASFDIGETGTMSFWVQMTDQSRRNAFFNSSDSFPGNGMEVEFRPDHGGELFAYLNKTIPDGSAGADNTLLLQNGAALPVVPPELEWFNVQLTWNYNGGSNPVAHLYVKGTEVTYTGAFDSNLSLWNQTLATANVLFQLGRHRTDATRFFEGRMDDVAFFNTELDATNLARIRAASVGDAQAMFGASADGAALQPVGYAEANGIGHLLAYWNFDDAVGSAVATGDAGTSIPLYIGPSTEGVEYQPHQGPTPPSAVDRLDALDFDGAGDAVTIADSSSLSFDKSQGTISFWVNPRYEAARNTVSAGSSTLFEDSTQQVEVGISWHTDAGSALQHADMYGRLYFSPQENSADETTNVIVSNTRLAFDQWTHVVITWDFAGGAREAHIYVNGQDDGFLLNTLPSQWTAPAGDTGDWVVGGDAAAAPLDRWFNGQLADVTIFGSSLSADRADQIFRFGAESTNVWDYSGATGRFAWDQDYLYGWVEKYDEGPNVSNGDFRDLEVEILNSAGTSLITFSLANPDADAEILPGSGATGSYEFKVPFTRLGGFDPTSAGTLQYRVRTIDSNALDRVNSPLVAGFDSRDTTLGFVTPPPPGTTLGFGRLTFNERETLFGLGGQVTYSGLADLKITTGRGDDNVRFTDDPLIHDDPNANAARLLQLETGDGDDHVVLVSLDAGYRAQTTILTEGGANSITQLADLTLGSNRSNGRLMYVADEIRLDADTRTLGGDITIDGATTLTSDVLIDTDQAENETQGGAVFFSSRSTIRSQDGEANDLVIDAGTSRVRFNADIGGAALTERLGRLVVEEAAAGVVFGEADTPLPDGTGPVTSVALADGGGGNALDIGLVRPIGGSGIVFNGGATGVFVVSTTGGNVRLNGPLTFATDVDIDTDFTDDDGGGGDILFTNDTPLNSIAGEFNDLTMDAGRASVFFNEDIGGVQALGALIVREADGGVTFGGADTETENSGGSGPVRVIRATENVDIGALNNVIGGSGIIFNGGSSPLTLTTANADVRLNGATTLQSAVYIDTGAGAGDITFTADSPIDSQAGESNGLTLRGGTGVVRFNENLGETDPLGALTVQSAGQVIFGAGDVETIGGAGPVNLIRTNGAIDLGSVGVITNGIVLNGGTVHSGNDPLRMSTNGQSIRFNGAVTLASDVELDTDATDLNVQGGAITFTDDAPLDSAVGEFNDLTLDAGIGGISFNANLGEARALGSLTVLEADQGVTFGGADLTAGLAGDEGPVNILNAAEDVNIGVGANVIGGVGIVLNGGASAFALSTANRNVRFNGPVTLKSAVRIDTGADAGDITFTADSPINSEAAETNDLLLRAGQGAIQFNANLGAAERLGAFNVDSARQVLFGASDTATPGQGGAGPVHVIRTNGALNVGAESVIAGGIIFNGGTVHSAGDALVIETTGDSVRLNGPVTLATAVQIDTDDTDSNDQGGAVTFTNDSPIDSAAGEFNDLTIDAGTAGVFFNEDLGRFQALGAFTILEADGGVTFGGADTEIIGSGGQGPVNLVHAAGPVDLGVGDNVLTGGGIRLNGGLTPLVIITTNQTVRLNGVITLQSDVRIDTDAESGDIIFTADSPIDSAATEANELVLRAGGGIVRFNEDVGATNRLGRLIVEDAAQIIVGNADRELAGTGGAGPVVTMRTQGAIDFGSLSVIAHGILLNGGTANSANDALQISTAGGSVRLNGAVTLLTDVNIATDGGEIRFTNAAPVDSGPGEFNDLQLDAGTASVVFNANLGAARPLGALTITRADQGVIFGGADTATVGDGGPVNVIRTNEDVNIGVGANVIGGAGILLNGGTAPLVLMTAERDVRLNGAVTLQSAVRMDTGPGAGNVLFTQAAPIDSQTGEANDLTVRTGTGTVRFNENLGEIERLGAVTIETATQVVFGEADLESPGGDTGPVNLIRTNGPINLGASGVIRDGVLLNGGATTSANDPLVISTTGRSVRINGAVTLATDVTIDTDASDINGQGGDITLTNDAPLDSAPGELNDLLLDAGTASIFFQEDIGRTHSLGRLTIAEADGGVTFGGSDQETVGSGGSGPVNLVRTTGDVDIGSGDNVIGGTGIILNGGANEFILTTSDHNVRLNGRVTLQSSGRIDTGLGGGDVTFTSDSPLDSQAGETNDLTLQAGGGTVRFNEDLGATERLGRFTLESAARVVFGEADTESGAGGIGPVNLIRTKGAIDLGATTVISGGIVLNGGTAHSANDPLVVSTTEQSIRLNGPVILGTDVTVDTDAQDDGSEGGDVTFTAAAPINSAPGEKNDILFDTGSADLTLLAAVGDSRPLGRVTIDQADDVNFAATLRTTGDVTQHRGTGVTAFSGTSDAGIEGSLSVTTNEVVFRSADVTTVGAVRVDAQNAITFQANAGLNAGASPILLAANQDGVGAEGFTQHSDSLLRTDNATSAAVRILVGGTGDARISLLRADSLSAGQITIVAGGAIVDNRANEDANLTARTADLTAGRGIGNAGAADIDTTLSDLTSYTERNDIVIQETNDLTLRNLTAATGSIAVDAGGVLSIENRSVLQSATGRVSNAPPLLRLTEDNPDDVILPGDPTQEVRGTIGGIEGLGDNLELGANFTITVRWDDDVLSTLGGLQAGDSVVWHVGPNNESSAVITHHATSGPIDIFIQREYPFLYLQTLTSTTVTADFTVFNDSRIRLSDVTPVNLNQTAPLSIDTSLSEEGFGSPQLLILEEPLEQLEEPPPPLVLESSPITPERSVVYQNIVAAETREAEQVAVLYLEKEGLDGAPGQRTMLPLSELRDLSRLLERLKKAQLPNGLYRIYYQEPGLPARQVLEFRKAGNVIGDPVREPGRGANPLEQEHQANPQDQKTNEQSNSEESGSNAARTAVRQDAIDAALSQATEDSFTPAARRRRRG